MKSIVELQSLEIDTVSGGIDHEVVATGLGIMLVGAEVGAVVPPAGGAICTIGALVALSGLVS